MIDPFVSGRIYEAARHKSLAKVGREFRVSPKTVRAIVEAGPKSRARKEPKKTAKKQALTKRRKILVRLAETVVKKGHITFPKYGSATALRAGLKLTTGELLSERQIQRELKAAGLKPYVRQPVPTRTPIDIAKRKAFGKRLRSAGPAGLKKLVKRLVFSDESWLCCVEKTGRGQYAKSRAQVLPREKKARWNVPSVMVWAGVGVGYKSPIVILPSKRLVDGFAVSYRLDSPSYIRKCLAPVVPDLIARRRVFQQDNARAHACKKTLAYLKRKGVEFVPDWPPYSPDLNAIERIWKELNSLVGEMCPLTMEELIVAVNRAWDILPQAVIDKHCEHFGTQIMSL